MVWRYPRKPYTNCVRQRYGSHATKKSSHFFVNTVQKCTVLKKPGTEVTFFCHDGSKMHLFEAAWRSNVNFLVKCLVRFLVKILVKLRTAENCSKLNNRNNSIHCNNKGARARSARPPLLFPSPLLLLLFSLTKILTKNLTKHLTKKLTLLRQAAPKRFIFDQF